VSFHQRAQVLVLAAAVASSVRPVAVELQQAPRPSAQGAGPAPTASAPSVGKPFRELFRVQPAAPPDPLHGRDRLRDRLHSLEAATTMQRARTVCGLTVWDVDPDIDPRMRLTAPQPVEATFAIRKLTPPVCQE